MSRSYTPPHYSAVGIQMMGQMFEQQMRMAQTFGMAAMASNPLFARQLARETPSTGPEQADLPKKARPVNQVGEATIRRARMPSPPPMTPTFGRTRATPV
ncbi:hypothetical protein D6850_13955 [Roseovarius spongiae]|uniref:Uncharacterized protein n=1 Tax=Roseovarius spongiae TaxID=2320272 RepID=A0A3A8ARF7_9RHOB|nr:hypothetical protein [Roseovarius spongiae]RKF13405.1 hypothetical protein D6850_13955 [Roseovarius spongiae]